MDRILDRRVGGLERLNWEKVLYVVLILLALSTRLWGLGDRVQSHDESIHTKYSWNLYAGDGFQHQPLMHGPFLFHATALSYFLFGDNDFTARVPVALMGVALVAFPYLLRRWLGRKGALAASFFLLISPSISYYSRYIRHDIPVILWACAVILAILSYLRDGRTRWLYVMAAGISLMFATKEVAFIYAAIFSLFLVGYLAVQLLKRDWRSRAGRAWFQVALGAATVGVAIWSAGILYQAEETPLPWWSLPGLVLGCAGAVLAAVLVVVGVGRDLRTYRAFDLIVVLVTLCAPFLAPIPIKLVGLDPLDYHAPTIYYSGAILAGVLIGSIGLGVLWDRRRWSRVGIIHYAIFLVLFTTFFKNGYGIASGFVGSLGYWLAQQAVERGSQPQYYYVMTVLIYEYLPLVLTLGAVGYLGVRNWVGRRDGGHAEPETHKVGVEDRYFIPFLLFWTVMAWVGYSVAGERMPWLTVHLALPMILLAGWVTGRFLGLFDWLHILQDRGWVLLLAAVPFAMAVARLISSIASGPFRGVDLAQLHTTGAFLGAVAGVACLGAAVAYGLRRSGWRLAGRIALLLLLTVLTLSTIRTSWRFCYITYDYPTEFLVYAHAGPGVNEIMRQIEELSRRTTGQPDLIELAYGEDGSTLFYWQLRNYSNAVFYGDQPSRQQMERPVIIAGRDQWDAVEPYLGDDYLANTYTYLWWPIEDYRGLTIERVLRAITDPPTRAALWDIWSNRDYRRYSALTGKQHTVDAWPLRSDFRLYVRRDVAAQVWELSASGLLESGPGDGSEATAPDPYAAGWQNQVAQLVFGIEGAEPGQFQGPRSIDLDDKGNIYVADTNNHRIQKFTPGGQFVTAWGSHSSVETETGAPKGFNEPWGLAIGPEGAVIVADTWNHRIQLLDPDGRLLTNWGLFGQHSVADSGGEGAFYGPRDVAIGPDGFIYVSDTGNKRVQVFDRDGAFVRQWGGGGALEGYLDEPVGIAIGPDSDVYVADTWNQRVQVFDVNGRFLRQWPIAGWESGGIDEKPYLDVDGNGFVYVTDPSGYRVLVFDNVGNYVLSFGQYGFDESSFALPTGIALDAEGSIYVVDARGHRVLVFAPLDLG